MSEILDSGNRRQFESGAVRDIAEGKGRMDLVPLDIVADLAKVIEDYSSRQDPPIVDESKMFESIDHYMKTGDTMTIHFLMWAFISRVYYNKFETAIMEVSIHYEEGAKKYVERNWEKGIPCHCYIDSALRHGLKYFRGDRDERHDRAFLWNLLGLLWTVRHKPEFNDLPFKKSKTQEEMDNKRRNIQKYRREVREMTYQSIIDVLNGPRRHT